MIKNSNNPSNNQHKIAASIIAIDAENGKDEGAIALPYFPRIGSDDCPEINFNEIPAWEPPQTQIILPKFNSDKDEEEIEYIRHLASSESLNTREQIDLFFKTLGFNKEDRIYIRCIPAKNIPSDKLLELGLGYKKKDSEAVIKKTIKGYIEWDDEEEDYIFYENRYNQKPQKHPWGIQKLEELNKKGYGIYFVVGQGGDNDEDIIKVDTLFYECDGINKDKQWEKQKKLYYNNKLSPIAIVETRNSIHVYYRREDDNDDSAKTFRFLQQRLIQLADSDPAIHNEARLMRLPGFDHVKWNDGILEFFPCILKLCDFNAPHYSDIDFHKTLPKWDEKRWGKKKKQNNSLDAHNIKNFSQNIQNNGYYSDAYNIKNFAPFLEAGEVRPHEIETYKCPAHNGTSNNSLHIFPNGAFKCHGGCDNRDIWRAAKDIAVAHGYVLPVLRNNLNIDQKVQELTETQQESWKEQRDKELKKKWQKGKTLTPKIITKTPYFQYLMRALPVQLSLLEDPPPQQYLTAVPEENLMLLGCGDLGGGKTTWMKSMIEIIREAHPTERWFAFGYINGLLLQQCGAWKKNQLGARRFKHLQSDKAFNDIYKESQDLALCVHSLKHFEDCLSVFDGCNIVIDEIVSVIKALLQDDNIKECDRTSILHIFSEALRRAKRVFCFDALLSDLTVWYLSQVCPQKKVISVKNEYQRPKSTIEFLLGTAELEKQLASVEKIKKSDNSPICKALLNSKRFVLVSDNRTIIQILGELLKEQGKEVLVICRDTNGQKDVKDFLECPNRWVQQNWINKNIDGCVLISPTGGSGIDISVKNYFTDLYGLFFGVIDVDAILQMLGRLRDNEAKFHVWVKDQGSIQNVLGNFSKEIHRNVRTYIDHLRTIIWEGYDGDPALDIITKFSNDLLEKANDIHFKAQCALISQQLYEEWHLRECLQETLIGRGYELEFITLESEEGSKKLIKDKREVYYKQRAEGIFNAADLTEEEVIEISSNFFQTPEQKDALQKFSLRSRLPGIEKTELWNADFIQAVVFTSPHYLYQLETLYLLQNPEVAKLKAQTRWAAALERESLRHFDILNERYARVRALQNINIEYFLDPKNSWDNSSPELIAAAKEAKKPHNKVALPKAPGKDLIKWINNILESLTYSPKLSRVDSNQRRYKITLDEEAEKQKTILLKCLGSQEKYEDLAQKQKSHIFRSKIAPNPCWETLKGDSTCGEFCLDKTSEKWSLSNPKKNTPFSKNTHVEDTTNGLGHWGKDTDIPATG